MGGIGSFIGDTVGSITGSSDAADAQERAAERGAALSEAQFNKLESNLAPYRQIGTGQIPALMDAARTINPEQELQQFYDSGEYSVMNQAANRNLMANQEALGVMGSSGTENSLRRIAPQLGQNYLGQVYGRQADDFNRRMAMVGMGQNAAAQTGVAGQNYASQAGQAYNQAGQAQAMGAMAPFQTMMAIGSASAKAAGGMPF